LIECGWVNYYEDCHTLTYADIFLLIKSTNISRSSAGWPNKLGDYMALGRPVLLNLYGDIKEFVNKYPSGFIMISLDQSSISEQLDKIIENEYCLKEMGHKNRIVAEENISWDARVKKLVNYLNNLN
jgi:glycosyltransferase involved in cell wall biosynthesis